MKLYIFVEGRETEIAFYPALMQYFHPEYSRINALSNMTNNSFYILSGLGMPNTFQKITSCLKDICKYNNEASTKIEAFAVVFDRDRYPSMKSAIQAVNDKFNKPENIQLTKNSGIKNFYIIQNPCIETWFLGNKNIIPQSFNFPELNDLIQKYDIRSLDPEKLSLNGMSEADSAKYYLDCIFKANGNVLGYHKKKSMEIIAKSDYIAEIDKRFKSGHISSFKYVTDLMKIL